MKCNVKQLISSLTIIISSSAYAQFSTGQFTELSALQGTWIMKTTKAEYFESWQKLNDSTYIGKAFKFNGKDTIQLESVQLIKRNAAILYVPTVQDQNKKAPTEFKLTKIEEDTYYFDNPSHDYPQRIVYKLPSNNELHAWIEGTVNGNFKKSRFDYKKLN